MIQRSIPYILTLLSGILGGGSIIAIKVASDYWGPMQILAVRWLIAFLFMTLLAVTHLIRLDYRGKSIKILVLVALLNPCFAGIGDTNGVAMTTASEASIILALLPFIVVLFSWIVNHDRIHPVTIFSIVLAVIGVLITKLFDPEFSIGGSVLGYGFLFWYMVCWSAYSLATSRTNKTFTSVEVTYFMTAMGCVWYNGVAGIKEGGFGWYTTLFHVPRAAIAVLFLGIFATCVGFLLLNYSVCRMPSAQNSMLYFNIMTLTGVIMGIVCENDSYGWYTFVGLFILLAAVVIVSLFTGEKQDDAAEAEVEAETVSQ